jgi:hypothetical protein
MTLHDYVQSELQARKGTWQQICAETQLDYSWLSKFAQGKIAEPGIHKVQRLADHFKQKQAA